jgi:hypothetical protein
MYWGVKLKHQAFFKSELDEFCFSPTTNSIYGIKRLNKIDKSDLNMQISSSKCDRIVKLMFEHASPGTSQ